MIDRNNSTGFGIANESMQLLLKRSVLNPNLRKPSPSDVSGFKNALSENTQNPRDVSVSGTDADNQTDNQLTDSTLEELLMLILELLAKLNKSIAKADKGENGGRATDASLKGQGSGSVNEIANNNSAEVVNGQVLSESTNIGRGNIPKPVEHMQSFNLGGKTIVIGGDGSASAAEVQSTKDTMIGLNNNSSTFRNMLDSSPNASFEVSVGKNSDNMSWGNSDGRIFMNVNNITPGNSDPFQALTAHEFAHAAVNQEHGSDMQRFESAVAREA